MDIEAKIADQEFVVRDLSRAFRKAQKRLGRLVLKQRRRQGKRTPGRPLKCRCGMCGTCKRRTYFRTRNELKKLELIRA